MSGAPGSVVPWRGCKYRARNVLPSWGFIVASPNRLYSTCPMPDRRCEGRKTLDRRERRSYVVIRAADRRHNFVVSGAGPRQRPERSCTPEGDVSASMRR